MIGLPQKIGCHNRIARYGTSPNGAYIPADATAAVAVVLDISFSIIYKMDQAKLFAALDGEIRHPRDLDPVYPVELEQIYNVATAFEPEDRFSTAADLHEVLQEYQLQKHLSTNPGQLGRLMKRVFADD